jgi:hypothetical protein
MKANLVNKTDYVMEFANDQKDFHVYAKWDGCCDINRYYNGDTYKTEYSDCNEEPDYIHICDLREFIEFLTEIADKCEANEKFDWK